MARQNPGATVLHVSRGGARAFRSAHVPGAIHPDTNLIERPPLWKLVRDADLERALLALGVTRTTRVVRYGTPTMAATRAGRQPRARAGRIVRGDSPGRPELIVDAGNVREMLGDPGAVVVSVRSLAEQVGETSG
jgi:thiosulfate/3-mercaptopyruvate sulfurtransferase